MPNITANEMILLLYLANWQFIANYQVIANYPVIGMS